MQVSERTLLIPSSESISSTNGLSLLFAVLCIIDVFGVFPIVTLPKAVIDCGYYGILVVVLVCSTQIYTAILLGKCWVIAEEICPSIKGRSRYPYSALAEITYGKTLSRCVTFLLDLTIFGGGIPNLIVASRNLQLLSSRIDDENGDISHCYWIVILGITLCPVLWLGSPKDMKCVCTMSVLMVVAVFLLANGCLLFNEETTIESLAEYETENDQMWKKVLSAYGIIAFQFDIHPSILTIQIDMNDKSKLPTAIIGAFMASLLLFGVTTSLAAIKYGPSIQSSILETLPTSVPLHIAACLIALQLCLTSAVSNNALYQHMEDCLNISREFNPKRCILRTILMVLAIVIAESVPGFDLVMATIGGTLTAPLVFIFPPMFYLRMVSLSVSHESKLAKQSFPDLVFNDTTNSKSVSNYRQITFREGLSSSAVLVETIRTKKRFCECLEKLLCQLIVVFSTCATLFVTFFNFTYTISSYANYTKPCIYNISAVLIHL